MKRRLTMVAGALAMLGVAFVAGRWSRPTRVETKEVVQWRERKIYLRREVRVADVRVAGRKVTRSIRLPDGTLTRETIEETASSSSASTTRSSGSTSESSTTAARTVVADAAPKWSLGMIGGFDLRLKRQPWAGAYLSRQVYGPISAGVFAGTGGNVGFTLGIRF